MAKAARPEAAERGAPDLPASRRVLLLVDFINPLDFDGAAELAGPAFAAAQAAAELRRRLAAEGVPAIYVNDNFGRWRSDFKGLLAHCRACGGPARRIAQAIRPQASDLTVLKPRHSAFFATPLELLLRQIGARELVVTGLATDRCVLLSAADAFVRGFRLWVPSDCCAAENATLHEQALAWMHHALRARTRAAA
jgi:nicotinamidase-related amidase